MKSSYVINSYGNLFKSLIEINKPKNILEIGILDGFSTLIIANTLKKQKIKSNFFAYDLFENYEFNSTNLLKVSSVLKKFNLSNNVKLINEDFYSIYKKHKKETFDFVHIDISNDGDVLKFFFDKYDPLIKQGAIVIFEGGALERDKVDWMLKYNKRSLKKEIEKNETINKKYEYITLSPYPSLTIFKKRIKNKKILKYYKNKYNKFYKNKFGKLSLNELRKFLR